MIELAIFCVVIAAFVVGHYSGFIRGENRAVEGLKRHQWIENARAYQRGLRGQIEQSIAKLVSINAEWERKKTDPRAMMKASDPIGLGNDRHLMRIAGEDSKIVGSEIAIVREIAWTEVLELANTGVGCTGLRNSGLYNSGNYNSGNYNRCKRRFDGDPTRGNLCEQCRAKGEQK